MTNNWHGERNSAIDNWHINNSRKDDRKLKATERPIAITYKDNKKDFEKYDLKKEVLKTLKITLTEKKESSVIEIMQQKNDIERQKNNNKKDGIVMERTPRIESKEDDSMHKETDIVKRQTRCSKDEKDNKNHDLKELKRQLSRKRKTMVILK